ncbi:MAG: hypothetical protein ACRDF6_08195 [bacterium]
MKSGCWRLRGCRSIVLLLVRIVPARGEDHGHVLEFEQHVHRQAGRRHHRGGRSLRMRHPGRHGQRRAGDLPDDVVDLAVQIVASDHRQGLPLQRMEPVVDRDVDGALPMGSMSVSRSKP